MQQVDEEWIQALLRSNRDFADFALIASHDLSIPLREIESQIELLLKCLEQDKPAMASSVAIRVAELSAISRSLLSGMADYSRVDVSDSANSQIDMEALIGDVADLLSGELNGSSISLDIGELPSIVGNRTQLFQLFLNLISNAITHKDPARDLRIRISSQRLTNSWAISVSDSGVGFDQTFADQIFEPAAKLAGSSHFSGGGLGLAICKRIVQSHGGAISARGEQGHGATFVIQLPGTQASASAA